MDSELLYRGIENRAYSFCSSLCLSIFCLFSGYICVTVFSGTVQATIYGKHMETECVYRGIEIQVRCPYFSIFFFIFLSFPLLDGNIENLCHSFPMNF